MARRTTQEQLDDINRRMEQLKNRQKQILAREKENERKARNHRLIEIGAEVEAALGFPLDSKEARKAFGDFLRNQEARGKWVTKALADAAKNENYENVNAEEN